MGKTIIEKILSGASDRNIRFEELHRLFQSLGFGERIKGSHYIYYKDGIPEIINLQPLPDGKAKPYQVKQVRTLIVKYKLNAEEDDA